MIADNHEEEFKIFQNEHYLVGCKRSIIVMVYVVMAKSGSRVRVSASDTTITALVQDGRKSSPTYIASVTMGSDVVGNVSHWKIVDVDASLLFAEVDNFCPTHTRLARRKDKRCLGRYIVDRFELDFDSLRGLF